MLSLDLTVELPEPLARYMLQSDAQEHWRDRPEVEVLGRAAALFEARNRELPPSILEVPGRHPQQAGLSDLRNGRQPMSSLRPLLSTRPLPIRKAVRAAEFDDVLAKRARHAYMTLIDFWPDNRAVSLLALPGARSDSLPNIDEPS